MEDVTIKKQALFNAGIVAVALLAIGYSFYRSNQPADPLLLPHAPAKCSFMCRCQCRTCKCGLGLFPRGDAEPPAAVVK